MEIYKRILYLIELATDSHLSLPTLASYYEQWEYQERQAKYVVHGQRLYDFLGYRWELPLWTPDFIKFWETVPLEYRFSQQLYRI